MPFPVRARIRIPTCLFQARSRPEFGNLATCGKRKGILLLLLTARMPLIRSTSGIVIRCFKSVEAFADWLTGAAGFWFVCLCWALTAVGGFAFCACFPSSCPMLC